MNSNNRPTGNNNITETPETNNKLTEIVTP